MFHTGVGFLNFKQIFLLCMYASGEVPSTKNVSWCSGNMLKYLWNGQLQNIFSLFWTEEDSRRKPAPMFVKVGRNLYISYGKAASALLKETDTLKKKSHDTSQCKYNTLITTNPKEKHTKVQIRWNFKIPQ